MEVRVDYLKSERIIYSNSRKDRPHNFVFNKIKKDNMSFVCPFCKENSNILGETIVENKFGSKIIKNIYPMVDGQFGIHDVAIESCEHELKLRDMDVELIYNFLIMIKTRAQNLCNMDYLENIQIFKNDGRNSGASLEHSHWQIVSTDFIPHKTAIISSNFSKYFTDHKKCILCSSDEVINVLEDELFILSIPKASYGSISFRLFPKAHKNSFVELSDREVRSLAYMLKKAANLVYYLDESASFNVLFFSEPANKKNRGFHFFVDIVDRKGSFGGFELSTGDFVNSTLPEELYEKVIEILEV